MAVVDSYSPCPCGSGQKFKWCCQKIEAYAERAQRLYESGQAGAAIGALDEGLRKEPHNAWLLTRKALYLIQKNELEASKATLTQIFEKNPKHLGARFLMTRLVLETEGSAEGAAQFQRAIAALDGGPSKDIAGLARLVGAFLAEEEQYPAALAHLELEQKLGADPEDRGTSLIRMIDTNPGISPWLKNRDRLSSPPEGVSDATEARFNEALGWAEKGHWASAAASFELLSTDPEGGPEADRNLGLCRLWMADNAGAVGPLRRYVAGRGPTLESVDLEALCQEIEPLAPDDTVEQLQWIWPIRDRDALLATLGRDPSFDPEGPGLIDVSDPESPEAERFAWLDRPMIEARPGLKTGDLPRFRARLYVGQESVALEALDDGRLDELGDRFTALAGTSIAPAQPKTVVLGALSRSAMATIVDGMLPDGLDPGEEVRLAFELGVERIRDVWPNTPMPYLGGRTPLAAAAAGDAEVRLRAAVLRFERGHETWHNGFDFNELRAMLKLSTEPTEDPETVDVERLHLARLTLVPVDRLDDDRLIEYYLRAKRSIQIQALTRAALILIDRPSAMTKAGLEPIVLYSDLVTLAAGRGEEAEAFDWLRRGRQAEAPAVRARNAPAWDMLEIRLKARTHAPEQWVPDLAVVMDRYGADPQANQTIMLSLVDLGLLRIAPNPDRPDDVMIDPRPLQELMSRFGPRVTTASGQLGVAASKGEIWTPGGSPSSGGIWTPGSGPANAPAGSGGEKPKLIIPGR
jgi:tetratricopeptide (TPR) repeat protein